MKRGIPVFLAFFASLTGTNVAAGATLYGSTAGPSRTGDLYSLDPTRGAGTLIGPIGFGVTGLAFDPLTGILYGSTSNKSNAAGSLITINPTTGAGTLVGSYGFPGQTMADLTFTTDGTLFGWLEPSDKNLYRIDKATGAATLVGQSGLSSSFGSGLAANASDVLYFAGAGPVGPLLYTIDPLTGLATPLVDLTDIDFAAAINAMAFSPAGVLFGVERNQPYSLVTINTATGDVTDLGPTVNLLDAIAFAPTPATVPEPASMALLGCGLVALAWRRRRC